MNCDLKFSLLSRGEVSIQLTLPAERCALILLNEQLYFYGKKFSAIGPLNDEQVNQPLDLGIQLKVKRSRSLIRRNNPVQIMCKTGDTLRPLTSLQLLDAAIWREIGSEEPQAPEAFNEALARLLARWMLTRAEAPEMEAITTLWKTRRPYDPQFYLSALQQRGSPYGPSVKNSTQAS